MFATVGPLGYTHNMYGRPSLRSLGLLIAIGVITTVQAQNPKDPIAIKAIAEVEQTTRERGREAREDEVRVRGADEDERRVDRVDGEVPDEERQHTLAEVVTALCEAGLRVSLETSGAMALGEVDPRVVKVVDVKTPGSGEEHRNRYEELGRLMPHDLVKFVICDRSDYEWSRAKLPQLSLPAGCTVLFSPSHEQLPARELADWILADHLPVRLQIQLHKYLWGNVPGK